MHFGHIKMWEKKAKMHECSITTAVAKVSTTIFARHQGLELQNTL